MMMGWFVGNGEKRLSSLLVKRAVKRAVIYGLAATSVVLIGQVAHGETTYTITGLGFDGEGFTDVNGLRRSYASRLNDAGQVAGYSYRYNVTGSSTGTASWLYEDGTLTEIGLKGAEYTRSDGVQSSSPRQLNSFGQVAGYSAIYSGSEALGAAAWLYDGSTTQRIGLTEAEYTRADGRQSSFVNFLNDNGDVAGIAVLFSGTAELGYAAWQYKEGATVRIGLTGSEFTNSASGYQHSRVHAMNSSGTVVGSSYRFLGENSGGEAVWISDGVSTQRIGLTGSEYTMSNGSQFSSFVALNDAGMVAGRSSLFGDNQGNAAWVYDGTSTRRVGLWGDGYVHSNGSQSSIINALNEAGTSAGYAIAYNGSQFLGQVAWLDDGSSTSRIGLTGTGFTRSDGYSYSYVTGLNDSGFAIGGSYRIIDDNSMGTAAWLYDGVSSRSLGLTGDDYVRADGYQASGVHDINAAGQVLGYSVRYGDADGGQSAWLYDPDTDFTYEFLFSVRDSDDYAYSWADYLADDGTVLGRYSLFDELGNTLGTRLFAWTVEDGMYDLGEQVEGGLTAAGWETLYSTLSINSSGSIVGRGELLDGSSMPFLLTPVTTGGDSVPEPATLLLFGAGVAGLVVGRRRVRKTVG